MAAGRFAVRCVIDTETNAELRIRSTAELGTFFFEYIRGALNFK